MNPSNKDLSLSVIVPAYNIDAYITECILSIQQQTLNCMEVIIVDDGSTDRTLEVCRDLSQKFDNIIVVEGQHQGVTAARKYGLNMARGKYVIFIDGDDYIEKDMFESLMKYAGKYDFVSCGVYRHFSENRVSIIKDTYSGEYFEKSMGEIFSRMIYDFDAKWQQPMTPWIYNKVFRRDIAIIIMNDIPVDISYAEDSAFIYKYILRCKSAYFIDKPLYHYRYRKESVYNSVNDKMLHNINSVYLCLKENFEKQPIEYRLIIQLQKWLVLLTMNAVNKYMGLDELVKVSQYKIDNAQISGKNIVLYGAGEVGQSIYRQLNQNNEKVVAWVDKDFNHYKMLGFNVCELSEIYRLNYDVVLIAVREEELYNKIKADLVQEIDENSILWIKPELLY